MIARRMDEDERPAKTHPTGFQFVLGGLVIAGVVALFFQLFSWSLTKTYDNVDAGQRRLDSRVLAVEVKAADHDTTLARLEENQRHLIAQQEKMNVKLDRLLERVN